MARQTEIGRIHDRPVAPGQVDNPTQGFSSTFTAGGYGRKFVTVTIDTAVNDANYTLTIQGKDGNNQAITIAADSDATKEEIRDALYLKSFDYPEIGKRVVVGKDPNNTDKLIVSGISPADDFGISEADANISLVVTQAASSGQNLPFGRGVFQDSSNRKVVRLMDSGQTLLGVTEKSIVENDINGNAHVKAGQGVNIRIQGSIVVELDSETASPAPGDQVWCRSAASANGEQGQFRIDNTDGSPVIVSGARWLTGALPGLGDTTCAVLLLNGMG